MLLHSLALKFGWQAGHLQSLSNVLVKSSVRASNAVSEHVMNGVSSSYLMVGIPLLRLLTHRNGGVWRSTILLRNGVLWVSLMFWKHMVPNMNFVSLSRRIPIVKEVRTNYLFFDAVHQTIKDDPLFGT